MLFEIHLSSTTYFSSSGITVKPQVMRPASASLKVTPTSRQMKATQQRFVLTFFDCFNLVRDQRTSCVPSIQRGSPSQPVPLIFGMTCAGIGGTEKMSRSGPTRPYSLMLPSGNWIHLWENFWRCFTGFARRTALLKCLNDKWKYMQIMSHSTVRACGSSRFMRAFYTTFDMKCLGPAIQTDGTDVQTKSWPSRVGSHSSCIVFCWIMSIFYTLYIACMEDVDGSNSHSHIYSFQTCVSQATKALNP